MTRLRAVTFLLLLAALRAPQPCRAQPSEPPAAPLPAALAKATRLFVGNAGDQENADCLRAYNVLYAGIGGLGRFNLVPDPSDADLILEVHYEIDLGQAIASNDTRRSVRQFRVVFEDPHSRVVLWSITERTNYAALQGNRNKNLDETVNKLTMQIGALLSPHPVPPKNDSKVKHSVLK